MATLSDYRIEDLVARIELYSSRIAERLSELAVTTEPAVRLVMRREIQALLEEVKRESEIWLQTSFGDILTQTGEELALLLGDGVFSEEDDILALVLLSITQFRRDLNNALSAIQDTSARLSRGDLSRTLKGDSRRLSEALSAGPSGAGVVAGIKARLSDRLKRQMVEVLGANGRIYTYDLSYYIALAAEILKSRSGSELTLEIARRAGSDLVQISENPSTIGDYCDLYRGKVFSISGTHPIFPALSLAPAGGPPFHPWCHHSMSPFDDSLLDDAVKLELAAIPEDFLELGRQRAPVKKYMELWNVRKLSLGF